MCLCMYICVRGSGRVVSDIRIWIKSIIPWKFTYGWMRNTYIFARRNCILKIHTCIRWFTEEGFRSELLKHIWIVLEPINLCSSLVGLIHTKYVSRYIFHTFHLAIYQFSSSYSIHNDMTMCTSLQWLHSSTFSLKYITKWCTLSCENIPPPCILGRWKFK